MFLCAVRPVVADVAASPTGRSPRLIWTPQQQAVWNQMVTQNHPWWGLIQDAANSTGTPNQYFDDQGQWGTLAYQMTGNPVYAQKAWNLINSTFIGTTPPDGGEEMVTSELIEYVLMYDWLYPALTPAQHTAFYNTLNVWADWCLGTTTAQNVGGTRVGDSDVDVGHYFGFAFLDLATGPDNPRAGTFLSATIVQPDSVPVGGLDATADDRSTLRNTLRQYADMAAGGSWFESSEYDQETLSFLLMGIEGVKTATGVDHFSEYTQLLPQLAREQVAELTPDLLQPYQWGDLEWPRNQTLYWRETLLGMLGGVTQNDPTAGPYVNQLVVDLAQEYGYTGSANLTARPYYRCFFFYNPYAPTADYRQGLPLGTYANGQGLMYARSDRTSGASLFAAQFQPNTVVDHEVLFQGDFQLYREGEWAVTHPLGYDYDTGDETNSMLFAGLSSMMQQRGPVAQEFGSAGDYAYLAGSTSGQYYPPDYWSPPPTFLHEWTRSLFYLPEGIAGPDTVVVYDRTNCENPALLPSFDRYSADDQATIQAAPALKQWVIHTPVAPTVNSSGISWSTAQGQQVRVSTLLPAAQQRTVYDESQLYAGYWNFAPSELHYQVRINPSTTQQWDTFLNVVQASNGALTVQNTVVRSAGGEAEGALVPLPGQNDALVLFGARQAGRVAESGYTVSWTPSGTGTNVYLLDLDPTLPWSAQVDGGAFCSVSVSSQGVGKVAVAGGGSHTLTLSAQKISFGNLQAQLVTNTSVKLSWTAPANFAQGFRAWRSTDGGTTWTLLNGTWPSAPSGGTFTYTDGGLAAGTTYTYRVEAYSGTTRTFTSNVSVTTPAPPAAPTNLQAQAVSSTRIQLTWSVPASTATGFRAWRSTDGGTSWALLNGTWPSAGSGGSFSYTDTGLKKGTTYTYRVEAYNSTQRVFSNLASATP